VSVDVDFFFFLQDAFIGSTSTSSVTLLWAMSEIIKSPRVMRKVQSEIRSSVSGKPRVEVSDTPQLKYLRMVIKETLRLHPPAPFLIPRETMQHIQLLGYDLPPRTRIFVNVWAIGRDPACWKNPEEFYPERFEDADIDFQGLDFELLPFGVGRAGRCVCVVATFKCAYMLLKTQALFVNLSRARGAGAQDGPNVAPTVALRFLWVL